MWTSITKPTLKQATRKSLIDAIIDNLTYLFGLKSSSQAVINGSFENDSDSDGNPDGWVKTLYTGGSFTLDDTDQRKGVYSAKFTSPGGGGANGGGYLTSEEFFEVSALQVLDVAWEMKSSSATVRNIIEIFWYDVDQIALGTPSTSLYDAASGNPTSWTAFSKSVTPPSGARFAKLKLTGCYTSSATAGSTWFDNVAVSEGSNCGIVAFSVSSTWTPPAGVRFVMVEVVGGGGGGAWGASATGGGGGAYARGIYAVAAGVALTVTIGAGGSGAGSSNNDGSAGGNTVVGSLITAAGGGGGLWVGTPSSGGASGGGQASLAGSGSSTAAGGAGGGYWGYGAGGAGNTGSAGANGGVGLAVIHYW